MGLVALGILLLIAWGVLWLGFHVAAGIVHVLVLLGVILLIWGFVRRGASAVNRRV